MIKSSRVGYFFIGLLVKNEKMQKRESYNDGVLFLYTVEISQASFLPIFALGRVSLKALYIMVLRRSSIGIVEKNKKIK